MLSRTLRQVGMPKQFRSSRRQTPCRLTLALLSVLLPVPRMAYAEVLDSGAEKAPARRENEVEMQNSAMQNPATQNPQHPAASAREAAHPLPAVTVTARQSEERVNAIPFAVSVIDGQALEERRLLTLEDALRSTPGVNVNAYGDPNSANVLIRGSGSLNQVSMDDGSVALTIDGVAMSMRNLSLGTLDVEQVEVLKGPQGTLFGDNSLAGAVNVSTRKPTRTLEGYLRGDYGQQRQQLEEAVISGPLSERLSGRFALRNTGSAHWVNNAQTGSALSEPAEQAFRGSLLWDVGGATKALFTAERQAIKRSPALNIMRPYGDPPTADFSPGLFNNNSKTVARYSAAVNHDLNDSRITSITALTASDLLAVGGYDRRLAQALYGTPGAYLKQDSSAQRGLSQDLRWSSRPAAHVFWVTGLKLGHSERSFDTRYAAGSYQQRNYLNNSQAVYGEVSYPLTAALKATWGLRHTWDRKSYDATYSGSGVVQDRRKLQDNYTTGRSALSYALTPGTNVYGVLARAYQSGGFSDFATQVADSAPYKPALSYSAEVGFKTESADRRFRLNGALFLTRVKDAHLLGYDYTTLVTQTITADSRSQGVELEGTRHFDNGLALSGGVSYIDARITRDAFGVSGGNVRAGNRAPDVPRWGGHLRVSYRKPLPGFSGLPSPMLNTQFSYQYVGTRAADPQNHFELGAYQKLDVRVGLLTGNAEIYVYGNNLLDQKFDLFGYYNTPTVTSGAPARGRTLGLGLSYYF